MTSLLRPLRSAVLGILCTTPFFSALAKDAQAEIVDSGADAPVPHFIAEMLPERTMDGREVPRRREWQWINAFNRMCDRGILPEHPGIDVRSIFDVGTAASRLADGDRAGYFTQETLAREAKVDADTASKVMAWFLRVGYAEAFKRQRRKERAQLGAGAQRSRDGLAPATSHRSTVTFLYFCPRSVAEGMTDEQLLDLIALGEKRRPALKAAGASAAPASERTAAAPHASPGAPSPARAPAPPQSSPPTPPPPAAAAPTPAAESAAEQLSPDAARALLAPLDALAQQTARCPRIDPLHVLDLNKALHKELPLPLLLLTIRDVTVDATASKLGGKVWSMETALGKLGRFMKAAASRLEESGRAPETATAPPHVGETPEEADARLLHEAQELERSAEVAAAEAHASGERRYPIGYRRPGGVIRLDADAVQGWTGIVRALRMDAPS